MPRIAKERYDRGNVFYKIANLEEHASKRLFARPSFVVVHDIKPEAFRHYLFLPRAPTPHLLAGDAAYLPGMIALARRLWQVYSFGGLVSGYKIRFNGLPGGGQVIPHTHMHLLLVRAT